ncbi:MAG: hypothetical protein HYW86_05185 [Candidatus Roizmanbacteria bacterium]|nr:MAG: hypothetical protein HYW86_05185 [Candidatus Roizmanbacteria bacterium]
MSENPVPAPDALKIPERLQFKKGLIGLQSRLLLGGQALNPDHDMPDLDENSLSVSLVVREQTTYKYLSTASTRERKDYWRGQNVQGFEAQKKLWLEQTTSAFQTSKEYFNNAGWDKFFEKIGINSQQFTINDAENLYSTYFQGDNKASQVQTFISKVVQAYADGQNIDYEKLKQDLPAIKWIAKIFGGTSSEVLTQLIDAEVKVQKTDLRQAFITQVNEKTQVETQEKSKINRLTDEEKRLLTFVWNGRTGEITTSKTQQKENRTKTKEDETKKEIIEISADDPESIKRGAEAFIQQLRNSDEITDVGAFINRWLVPNPRGLMDQNAVFNAAERYNLPMAILNGQGQRMWHQTFLLKAPTKDVNGKWRLITYDPYKGKTELIADEFDEAHNPFVHAHKQADGVYRGLNLNIKIDRKEWEIKTNPKLIEKICSGESYDLIQDLPDNAFPVLQKPHDNINCVGYSLYMGLLCNGFRSDLKPEEIEGLKKFEQDFGIRIKPRREYKETPDADWEKLKDNPSWFTTKELWENASQIRDIAANSEVIKNGLPVYYPGSGRDIAYSLAFTNADKFVFTDYVYINEDGSLRNDYLPDETIQKIGGKIISDETEGILGKGGKRVVKFDWGGRERTVVMYAEDATKFTPQEIENGNAFTIIKAPTPFGRTQDSDSVPGNIWAVESHGNILKQLALGGFIHWVPTQYLNQDIIGFKNLIKPKKSDDPLYPYKNGYPLYQKVTNEPNVEKLMKIDDSLAITQYLRDGGYTLSINDQTLGFYEDRLKELRQKFDGLPLAKQKEVIPILNKFLRSKTITEEQKKNLRQFGRGYGLDDEVKMKEYWEKTIAIAESIFPEFKDEVDMENVIAGRGFEEIQRVGYEKYRRALNNISYAQMIEYQMAEINRLKAETGDPSPIEKDEVVRLNKEALDRVEKLRKEMPQEYGADKKLPFVCRDATEVEKLQIGGLTEETKKERPITRVYFYVHNRHAPEAYLSLFEELKNEDVWAYTTLALYYGALQESPESHYNNNNIIIYNRGKDPKAMKKIAAAVERAKEKHPEYWITNPQEKAKVRSNLMVHFNIPLDESTGLVEMPSIVSYDSNDLPKMGAEIMGTQFYGKHFEKDPATGQFVSINTFKDGIEPLYKKMRRFTPSRTETFQNVDTLSKPLRRKHMPGLLFEETK